MHSKCDGRIHIIDVACAWEPLILKCEQEKGSRYEELARDLATQLLGWRTKVYVLVVGDLGSLASFKSELESTPAAEGGD